ncbi:OmpA family protein [Echinicola shivajiensis]|uniref:OmpA family protein n=1 Tax=Echinicola shivajiensis TaxID=1035916 RepID=UPI001BFCB599|nr:OmpA family protein [Echinicola shivajiensis]
MNPTPTKIPLLAVSLLASSVTFAVNGNQHHAPTEIRIIQEQSLGSTKSVIDFEMDTIPISKADLGTIPFFSLPNNIHYESKPLQREYDEIYFPIGDKGKLEKIAGRSFKSYLMGTDNSEWSRPYFIKSYDEAIKAAGGVKVFEGKFKPEQIQFMKENAGYLGEEGSLDFYNNTIHSYIIRRPDGDDIHIQFDANTAGGSIQIVQKEPFVQTITLLRADQIQKELLEDGKSILYINFDTDKASLKPQGEEAVLEIAKVLKEDKNLKIAVHGYTDNTGGDGHNQNLSELRAETIVQELVKNGIDPSRLYAKGFGAKDPIADNATAEGRAKNRRVELIKM